METIFRRTRGRAKWWTVTAAVVGLAAHVAAQSADTTGPGGTLPVRPAAGSWPTFSPPGASPFYPPEIKPVAATLPSLDSLKPGALSRGSSTGNGWSVGGAPTMTTSPNLPSFAGLGAAKPAGSQSVSATGALLPTGGDSGSALFPDRSPKEFGSGWKTFINQQLHSRERSGGGAAAQLAAPRSASSGPRPDWNWHGYDGYNMGQARRVGSAIDNAGASDLAPYMKYAHLWRPAGRVAAAAAPATPAKNNPALTHAAFDKTSSAPLIDDANSRWNGYGKVSTPENAKPASHLEAPMSAPADPGSIQFHAAPLEARPPAPLPPLPAVVPPLAAPKPPSPLNVNYPPAPSEPTNRLPLQVREKISQICNGRCRNLVVEAISPIRLRVGFLVKDQSEADMLTNQLGGASELAPYKVDFEVQIGQ